MEYATARGTIVTKEEARAEIEAHNCSWSEFLEDEGTRSSYKGSTVLAWLGY